MGYFTDCIIAFEGHHHPYEGNILKLHTAPQKAALAVESQQPIQAAVAGMNNTVGKSEISGRSEKLEKSVA